ncbi:hypothetical protein Bca101_095930 [Brassica carinata]
MDSNKGKENPILPAHATLDKLVLEKKKQHVAVRLLRMWEAINFNNRSLMSLDFLLLDNKDALIQGSIHHRRLDGFKDRLKKGIIYLISDFEVVPIYPNYKVADHPFSIRFTDNTDIVEIDEKICSIKHEKFRLYSYSEFETLAGTNLHLIDVVGRLLKIQGSYLEDSTSTEKIVLLLLLDDNSTVRVTLWDNQASDFRRQYQQAGNDCFVIVFTCLNPKMFAGKLHLNSSGSTKIFIDNNLEVVQAFMKRMGIETTDGPSKIVEEDKNKLHVEMWTIEEILQYVSSGADQEKEVICRAKVIDISSRNGWKYLGCGSCSHKLGRSETSLICNNCPQKTIIGVARFRIELVVESGDRTTTFVLFDRDAKKVTHTTAEEITALEEKEEGNTQDNQKVPKCLLDIIGKTMDFQVKIAKYNFETSFQAFTVTRITKENSIVQPEMDGNIKKEDGKACPTLQTSSLGCETGVEGKNETENAEKEAMDEVTTENEAKKRRIN